MIGPTTSNGTDSWSYTPGLCIEAKQSNDSLLVVMVIDALLIFVTRLTPTTKKEKLLKASTNATFSRSVNHAITEILNSSLQT